MSESAMKRTKMQKPARCRQIGYGEFWRVIDGAVAKCFEAHPEYFSRKARHATIRQSIVKRVTGDVTSYVAQATRTVPEVVSLAVDMEHGESP